MKTEKKENKKQEQEEESKLALLTEQLQRLQAEFENYIKRQEREQADYKSYAKKELLKELLVIYDDLGRAVAVVRDKNKGEGFKLVHEEFAKLLKKEGIEAINAKGQIFNADYHEVLQVISDKKTKDNTITEEYQRGYKLHDKVLRYSKVQLNKHPEETGGGN